jgi:hypothetical protein
MLVDVVRLRRAGLRLRPAELASPVRGLLEFSDDDGRHSSFKRPTRTAHLYERVGVAGVKRGLLVPLCDATVILIEGDTITIVGVELDTRKEMTTEALRVTEFGQVWRCKMAPSASPPTTALPPTGHLESMVSQHLASRPAARQQDWQAGQR